MDTITALKQKEISLLEQIELKSHDPEAEALQAVRQEIAAAERSQRAQAQAAERAEMQERSDQLNADTLEIVKDFLTLYERITAMKKAAGALLPSGMYPKMGYYFLRNVTGALDGFIYRFKRDYPDYVAQAQQGGE